MELNIFTRLVFERERLGLNKAEMAAAGGVAQPTYLRYETGDRAPDGEFYAKIAAQGADVLYILTGQRSKPMPEVDLLSHRQRALLSNYDGASEEGKKHIEGTASLLSQQKLMNSR